jgi:hypothetical protein
MIVATTATLLLLPRLLYCCYDGYFIVATMATLLLLRWLLYCCYDGCFIVATMAALLLLRWLLYDCCSTLTLLLQRPRSRWTLQRLLIVAPTDTFTQSPAPNRLEHTSYRLQHTSCRLQHTSYHVVSTMAAPSQISRLRVFRFISV